MILDAIGGKSFRTSYSLLRPGGRLVAFGASSVVSGEKKSVPTALKAVLRMPRFNLIKQMSESKTVIGLNMLTPVEGPRHAGALDRPAQRDAEPTARSIRSSPAPSASRRPARRRR